MNPLVFISIGVPLPSEQPVPPTRLPAGGTPLKPDGPMRDSAVGPIMDVLPQNDPGVTTPEGENLPGGELTPPKPLPADPNAQPVPLIAPKPGN